MTDIFDFIEPFSNELLSNYDEGYTDGQLGKQILTTDSPLFDINNADIVFVGVTESRGNGKIPKPCYAADEIRKHLYNLMFWHTDIVLADIGNIKQGASKADSYAAIKTVVEELFIRKKTVVLLGGSHDVTLAQYMAYKSTNQAVEVTGIDAEINISTSSKVDSEHFLMQIFTGEPNLLKHYNHIGFQSYYTHPGMLQTLDKLKFDFYRLGNVLQDIYEMEPILRNTDLVTFDIAALKYSDAPVNKKYPNGFTGIEACTLTNFAGMSQQVNSIGFYGFDASEDKEGTTAAQIAQMVWYFIDGKYKSKMEAPLTNKDMFEEFSTLLTDYQINFVRSKRTSRWWMQMPNESFVACSYNDYLSASNNILPERWFRVQERS
jgi:formiminoglutamase